MTETPPANTSQDLQVSHVETEPSTPLFETDYEAIAAAVMETERGRWFLQEYARRNRNADTQSVLTAIEKLEKQISENDSAPKEATSIALLGHDLIDLAGAISQVKKEVSELGGQGNDPDHFNSATVELEAIVDQTESATSEILEAAEKIQEVAWVLREEGASQTQCDIIESKIVDIYTACSFQDLTGQRSNKVVQLVGYVERRVTSMMSILGLSDEEISAASSAQPREPEPSQTNNSAPGLTPQQRNDARPDAELLNGPAMAGEGNEQGDVDALFDDVLFDEAPDLASEPVALDGDVNAASDTDDDEQDDTSFDELESRHDDLSAPNDGIAGEDASINQGKTSPDDVGGEDIAAIPAKDEATSEAVDATPATPKENFGEDDDKANTPEVADVFGFDVYGDTQLVEIHDAEILSQPTEDALIESVLTAQGEQDIFEIDPLSFGGDAIGNAEDSDLDSEMEAETDGAPKVVVDLPGDFDVDSPVADMFVGPEDDDQKTNDSDRADDRDHGLVDGQDIFATDSIDVEPVSAQATEAEDESADAVLIEPDQQPASDPDNQKQDILASDDPDAIDAEDVFLQSSPDDDEALADVAADLAKAEPIEVASDVFEEAVFDEDAVDEAFATLEADAALQVKEDRSEIPDAGAASTAAASETPAATAEDLMEEALAATNVAAKDIEYSNDEYTVEERVALFS